MFVTMVGSDGDVHRAILYLIVVLVQLSMKNLLGLAH